MKITKKTRANFEFYLLVFEKFRGEEFNPFEPEVDSSSDGMTALECFSRLDNQGKRSPCREPQLLQRCLSGKALLGLQVKQWAEGIHHGLFTVSEFMESHSWMQDWVWESLRRQAKKMDVKPGEFPRIPEPEPASKTTEVILSNAQ